MAPANLSTLPTDVLLLISQYLNSRALLNLALVDRQSHAAACHTLFQSVTLRTDSIRADVDWWKRVLLRNSATGMVRHLRLDGGSARSTNPAFLRSSGEGAIPTDFTSLMELFRTLSGLTKLTWACALQLPEVVLDTLHRRFPSCQIHLEIFRLHSVFDPPLQQYEKRLLSSPNLHTIRCGIEKDQDKIILHVLGLAPNIRSLELRNGEGCVVYPKKSVKLPKDSPWLRNTGTASRLECFMCQTPLDLAKMTVWTNSMDTARLRKLTLDCAWVNGSDSRVFDHLRVKCDFQRLNTLELHIPTSSTEREEIAMAAATRSFLLSLRPLSTLHLSGDMDCTLLEPILEHHGQRLRSLDLSPIVGCAQLDEVYLNHVTSNAADFSAILSHCVVLEELSVPVPRTCGDKDEVAIYRALGSLPRLQSVNIMLDARNPDFFEEPDELFDEEAVPTDADFDAWDNEFLDDWAPEQGVGPRKGHIRKAFINSAIDRKLVEGIFQVISASKSNEYLPLEEVCYTTNPGGWTGSGVTSSGAYDLCFLIGKCWKVRRGERDDKRDQIESHIRSGDHSKLTGQRAHRDENDLLDGILEEWNTVGPIFRKLWPSPRDGYDGTEGWQEDWTSFPLSV